MKLSYIQRDVVEALFHAGPDAVVERHAYYGYFEIGDRMRQITWATVLALFHKDLLYMVSLGARAYRCGSSRLAYPRTLSRRNLAAWLKGWDLERLAFAEALPKRTSPASVEEER